MIEINLRNGATVEREHATIKYNGWVKAYDSVDGPVGQKEYDGLVHYPPQRVENVKGNVTFEQTGGI